MKLDERACEIEPIRALLNCEINQKNVVLL